MTPTVANIRLGQCDVTYNGQALGLSQGGVEITIKNGVTEVAIDKYGSAPAKAYHAGTRIEIMVGLSEYNYDILVKVLNGAQKIAGGGMPEVDSMTIGDLGGAALAGAALLLHPSLAADTTTDVHVYKAVVIGETKLPFKVDQETTYQVTFVALVDETKSDGQLLATFGGS